MYDIPYCALIFTESGYARMLVWSLLLSAFLPLWLKPFFNLIDFSSQTTAQAADMTQLLLLGKFEYGGGPIFKVVLEC